MSCLSDGEDQGEDVDNAEAEVKDEEKTEQKDLLVASEDTKDQGDRKEQRLNTSEIIGALNELELKACGALESHSEDFSSELDLNHCDDVCCVCKGGETIETLLFDYELLLARLDATEAENIDRVQQVAEAKSQLEDLQAGRDRAAVQLSKTKALLLNVHAENVLLKRILEIEKGSSWFHRKNTSKSVVLPAAEDECDEHDE